MEEKTIELDAPALEAIVKRVSEAMQPQLDEIKKAATPVVVDKEVNKTAGSSDAIEGEVVSKYADLDKVDFAAAQFKAFVTGDHKTLTELNEVAIKSYDTVTKATYLNAGVAADGGAIVPNHELLSDVFSVLGVYSEVAGDLRVVTLTEGTGIDVTTLVQDVVVSEVSAEGGNKPVTKLVFGEGNVDVREFAGIAIMTKRLVRQAAQNVYQLLQESFARAIARRRAAIALTDATSGIVNKAGVVEVTKTANRLADLKKMIWSIPAETRQGGKFYVSSDLVEELDGLNDTTGRSLNLVTLDANGTTGTINGTWRFAIEDELGGSNPDAVFGAMGRFGILVRQGAVENETFDTGTVVDGSSVTHNLLQQNKLAQRVAFYENVGFPIENAFSVLVDA